MAAMRRRATGAASPALLLTVLMLTCAPPAALPMGLGDGMLEGPSPPRCPARELRSFRGTYYSLRTPHDAPPLHAHAHAARAVDRLG